MVRPMALPLSLSGRRWTQRTDPDHATTDSASVLDHLRTHRQLDGSVAPDFPVHQLAGLLPGLDRIKAAIAAKEKIAIFGDYDCDGITATAILARAFHRRGVQPLLRLPHRLHEGYGLKMGTIDELAKAGITLLITADTGVSSALEIASAKKRGMDVIVIDHHHLPAELPPAVAILHPLLLPLSSAPAVSPAAAGVAWSVVRAWEEREGGPEWESRDTDLALAAIGTVGDLVELRGSNRTLVEEGLKALNRIKTGPLALLKMQAGITEQARSSDIAFRIAPRINAAGRMADPSVALIGLLGNEEAILQLEEWNRDRQTLVASLTDEALELARAEGPMICLGDPRYAPGICGLISGRVTDRIGRPSLVAFMNAEGECTASLRSVPGYNVTEGLERISDLLRSYGGHAAAAGCSFPHAHLPEIRRRLCDDVRTQVEEQALVPSLLFDATIPARLLSIDLCRALRQLEPFGQGNPEPVFVIENAVLTDMRAIGRDSTHLQARAGGIKLIGFGLAEHMQYIEGPMDLAVHVGIDTWQGALKPQLFLQDLRVSQGVRIPIR